MIDAIEAVDIRHYSGKPKIKPCLVLRPVHFIRKKLTKPVIYKYGYALCPNEKWCVTLLNQTIGLKRCPICGQRIEFTDQEGVNP